MRAARPSPWRTIASGLSLCALTTTLALTPKPAQASKFPGPCLGDCTEFTTTTYYAIGTSLVVGITYAAVTTIWVETKEAPKREEKKKEAIKRYLDEHTRLVIEGATIGGGPGIDDLATICQLDDANRRHLAMWLRQHRAQVKRLGHERSGHDALATLILEGLREA